MKSKTSSFNKPEEASNTRSGAAMPHCYACQTFFRKNVIRFWPIWAVYMIYMVLIMPMNLFNQNSGLAAIGQTANDLSQLKLNTFTTVLGNGLSVLPIAIFSIITATAVFSYLYSAKSCNMIHSFPISRKQLFFTNYISGILFLIVPQFVAFLSSIVVCIVRGTPRIELLLLWFVITLGLTFFFFSLAVFCCMFSGNYAMGAVFFLVVNCFYQSVRYLIGSISTIVCYGLSSSGYTFASTATSKAGFLAPGPFLAYTVGVKKIYDSDGNVSSFTLLGGKYVLLFCIVAVILTICSLLLYEKRQLESAGDVVSVKLMRPIFRWLVALSGGLSVSELIAAAFFSNSANFFPAYLIFTICLTIAFFYIAEMILQKNFRVFHKRQIVEWCICTALAVAFLTCIKTDVFYIEREIPAVSDVKAVSFSGSYEIFSEDADTIAKVVDVHQAILDHKSEYQNFSYLASGSGGFSLPALSVGEYYDPGSQSSASDNEAYNSASLILTYYLKDGSSFSRYYTIPSSQKYLKDSTQAAAKVYQLQNNPDLYLQSMLCLNYPDCTVQSGDFLKLNTKNGTEEGYIQFNAQQAETLFAAYQKDLKEGHVKYNIDQTTDSYKDSFYNDVRVNFFCNEGVKSMFDRVPDVASSYFETHDAYISEDVQSSVPATTSVLYYLNLNSQCTNTIQTMIQLGLIHSADDLLTVSQINDFSEN